MKKLLVCFVVVAFLLVPVMAMANGSATVQGTEIDTWAWNEEGNPNAWTSHPAGDLTALARCWATGVAQGGECNVATHSVSFTQRASVAQWCKWSITNNRWDWRIRKPGIYAADCLSILVQSNGDIKLTGTNFTNLERSNPAGEGWRVLECYYLPVMWREKLEGCPEISPFADPYYDQTSPWFNPSGMNKKFSLDIGDSKPLHHDGYNVKLYSALQVIPCNSVDTYTGGGTIIISLMNQQAWIDGETGEWMDPQPGFGV